MQDEFAAVKAELQNYADRGLFRNLSVSTALNGGIAEFRFDWLTQSSFHLKLNVEKHQLVLHNVLPCVPFRSDMDKAFRNFLVGRCDEALPAHRRLDGERFTLQCRNRKENLSVSIDFQSADAAAATKTAINLLHEIFNNFLMDGPYQNYMVEVFNTPEE
ncbi:MAG: hypothetical protein O2971_03970 [Proteobacteria bacterium]|nr:hypothetical protein [Pseudomonadota bacterium]